MEFIPIAAALPVTDSPCLGTALFRDDKGLKYFSQVFVEIDGYDNDNSAELEVDSFLFLEGNISSSIVEARSNRSTRAGETKIFALSFGDGEIMFKNRKELLAIFDENTQRFADTPYLFYQLATLSKNRKMITLSLLSPKIVSGIVSGHLNCKIPSPRGEESLWNSGTEELLERLWGSGLSASRIAEVISGPTRNAILGKIHRMGISNNRILETPSRKRHREHFLGDL